MISKFAILERALFVWILGACVRPDLAAAKQAKADEVPHVDLSKLDDSERKIFFKAAGKVASACGKAHSLLFSAKNDPSCKRTIFALRNAVKMVDSGYLESEVVESLEKRYLSKAANIDVTDTPMKGDPKARVTLVEFVDFECPHCRTLQPVLDRLLEEYKGQVRVFFKHYPLKSHTYAEPAAYSAVAAHKQGKFWALTTKFWANQASLTQSDQEKYAREVGLDLKKWKEDLASGFVREKVLKDRADGDKLNIQGTPVVYVNGHNVGDSKEYEVLRAWIEEELEVSR